MGNRCREAVNWVARAEVSARSFGSTPIIPSASQSRSCYAGGRGVRSVRRHELGRSTTAKGGLRRLRSFVSLKPNGPIIRCIVQILIPLTKKFETSSTYQREMGQCISFHWNSFTQKLKAVTTKWCHRIGDAA